MGLDNVAVQWPRTGRFYDPVAPAEFVDFAELAETPPHRRRRPPRWPSHIAKTGTVRATAYTELVDLLLGLEGVLFATDAAAEDEDPVIDPDGCAWIAGGLEQFVAGHAALRRRRSPSTPSPTVLRAALGRRPGCAEQQLRWLDSRLDALRDEHGDPPQWSFSLLELDVLAQLLPPLRRPRLRRLRRLLSRRVGPERPPVSRPVLTCVSTAQVLQFLDGRPEPLRRWPADPLGLDPAAPAGSAVSATARLRSSPGSRSRREVARRLQALEQRRQRAGVEPEQPAEVLAPTAARLPAARASPGTADGSAPSAPAAAGRPRRRCARRPTGRSRPALQRERVDAVRAVSLIGCASHRTVTIVPDDW